MHTTAARTDARLEILYFYRTCPHRLHHSPKKQHQEKKNLDCLPQAIHAARYQDVNVSTGSYLKQSHRGARRQGHKGSKAQSVSDNGGEGAWPASSRVRLRVGDKETERRRSFAGEGRRHVRASSHSAWREHVRFPATIRSISISITITIYYLRFWKAFTTYGRRRRRYQCTAFARVSSCEVERFQRVLR